VYHITQEKIYEIEKQKRRNGRKYVIDTDTNGEGHCTVAGQLDASSATATEKYQIRQPMGQIKII
jgi:hypothetical protein